VALWLRFLIFGLVTCALLAGLGTYLFRRLVRSFGLGRRARRALGVTLGLSLALPVGTRALAWMPSAVLVPVEVVAYGVLLAAGFAAVLLGGVDLAMLAASIPGRARRAMRPSPPPFRARRRRRSPRCLGERSSPRPPRDRPCSSA
jgi:hypothetical protein